MFIKDINDVVMFEGDRSFVRFGWSLVLIDVNQDGVEDLFFVALFRIEDIIEELRGGLYLKIFIKLGVWQCLFQDFFILIVQYYQFLLCYRVYQVFILGQLNIFLVLFLVN